MSNFHFIQTLNLLHQSFVKHTSLIKSVSTELEYHMVRNTFLFSTTRKFCIDTRSNLTPTPLQKKWCQYWCDCTFTLKDLPLIATCLSILWLNSNCAKGQTHLTSAISVLICPPWKRTTGSQIIKPVTDKALEPVTLMENSG